MLANRQIPLRKMYYHVNASNRALPSSPFLWKFDSYPHRFQLSGPMPSHLGRSKSKILAEVAESSDLSGFPQLTSLIVAKFYLNLKRELGQMPEGYVFFVQAT